MKLQQSDAIPPWHIFVWLSILAIYLGVNVPYSGLRLSLLRGLLNTGLLGALFYFYQWWLRRFEKPESNWKCWLVIFLTICLMTLLRTRLNNVWLPGELNPLAEGNRRVNLFWASLASNFGVLSLSYLFLLSDQRRKSALTQLKLREERRIAELQQLRSQINPHFLFNVLNNVYSLASMNSPRTATTVLQLSDLLRYVTYDGQLDGVSIGAEVEQLERYISLFRLRSEVPLDINLRTSVSAQNTTIEPLLLLPLVENAFKHGDFIINQSAYAHFELIIDGRQLIFMGENSYDPAENSKDQQGGVGLENIRQRLALSHPTATLKTLKNDKRGIYKFELSLPLQSTQIADHE
ncbi:hypothetical protein CEQ90_05835 [Lewinellaceae bacterium SD302]|nr:hypothetical protein CEQ90_05835 [Lewinellaceae bacterium SD302]